MPDSTEDLTETKKEIIIKSDKQDSVTLKKGTRGDIGFEIKLYSNITDNKSIDELMDRFENVIKLLGLRKLIPTEEV